VLDSIFFYDKRKGREKKVSKDPNTETVCEDVPYIAVKNAKVVYNDLK
jgi:hypothetical protein